MGQLTKVQPGRATWKFVLPGNKFIYRVKNIDALKVFYNLRDQQDFTVYVRTRDGWEWVLDSILTNVCGCGRRFDDTPSGEIFKHQEPNSPYMDTIEKLKKQMLSPIYCMYCFYKKEIEYGRWAPRVVKRELGLD